MDALGYELQLDPIEFRMRNEPGKDPVNGNELSSRHMREAYRMGAEKFGWNNRPGAVPAQREGDWNGGIFRKEQSSVAESYAAILKRREKRICASGAQDRSPAGDDEVLHAFLCGAILRSAGARANGGSAH